VVWGRNENVGEFELYSTETKRPQAVLVGLQLPNVSDEEHQASLIELGRLVQTLGFDVIGKLSQKRKTAERATILGEGKLVELAQLSGGTGKIASQARTPRGKNRIKKDSEPVRDRLETDAETDVKADMIVFDDELSPTQLRNLESATGADVLDRTGVIIEIFYRHAKSREAQIQVEIARLRYLSPRLRMSRSGQDRQGGGIGAKGIGETAHELDKRRIRDRIAELKDELEEIHKDRVGRRQRRKDQLKVALIGYTNAGKSSLMRALTGSDVLVENKLFATLDTTIRAMQPETLPRILVSDTVGFIKKLPHDLVASFRSTLDEAADASLLLYVVDASDPTFRSQLDVTRAVLSELDLSATPNLLVLNKVDCLDKEQLKDLLGEFPHALAISALNKGDITQLREWIITHFEKEMVDQVILIPYDRSDIRGEVHRTMRVLSETHEENGTKITVRAPQRLIDSTLSRMT
jgi:GTP-binding protein HflX